MTALARHFSVSGFLSPLFPGVRANFRLGDACERVILWLWVRYAPTFHFFFPLSFPELARTSLALG